MSTLATITPIRLVIALVGAVALLALAGVIALAVLGRPAPDVLQNVAVGALTGLVGLLVPAGDSAGKNPQVIG